MNFLERNEMLEKIKLDNYNPFINLSASELLNKIEQINELIPKMEDQLQQESDPSKRQIIEVQLADLYQHNSEVFKILFKVHHYNVTVDEICELLDTTPHFIFTFFKSTMDYVKVKQGATYFIKDLIFEPDPENPNKVRLKRDPETGKVLEEAKFFQPFHRKKMFFNTYSLNALLTTSCEVEDSRMFIDLDLRKYFYKEEAQNAIRDFLVENGYSRLIEKTRISRKTKKEEKYYKIESVNQPCSLHVVVEEILIGKIVLYDSKNFKEQIVRNYCKAAHTVHSQQMHRFLNDLDETEFVKFAIPSTSNQNKRPNYRYYAHRVEKNPDLFRIAVAWGTDVKELKKQIFNHIKEFKEEKKSS